MASDAVQVSPVSLVVQPCYAGVKPPSPPFDDPRSIPVVVPAPWQ